MKQLTAYNKSNDREIEMMVSKAMCAYANMTETKNNDAELSKIHGRSQVLLAIEGHRSEYEATVRCIAMFVREHVPEICLYIIERCEEEFGI